MGGRGGAAGPGGGWGHQCACVCALGSGSEGGAAGRKGWGRRGARAPARTSFSRRRLPRVWPLRVRRVVFFGRGGAGARCGGAEAWLPAASGGAASNPRLPFMVITRPAGFLCPQSGRAPAPPGGSKARCAGSG